MSLFSKVAGVRTQRSKFNLSHEKKMSMNMGDLIPIMVDEIVPGDKFKVNTEVFMRFAPMLAPIMHRVNVYTHYFFVPNRLVWDNWESFITGGTDGTEAPVHPFIQAKESTKASFAKKRLTDYMNIDIMDPTETYTGTKDFSSLPLRAYQLIYNEYFRDQNLQEEIAFSKGDGGSSESETNVLTNVRKRAWEKDYFTSALPWAQRGNPILMPMSIQGDDITYRYPATGTDHSGNPLQGGAMELNTDTKNIRAGTQEMTIENIEAIENASITIEDLRKSVRLQEWLERQARGGARYIETILSHFGVRSSDARLQRPEYLSGGKQPVTISEVLQTSTSAYESSPVSVTPQGNMSGHGISVGAHNGFNKSFEEHGYVIGIMSVLPRTSYQNGTERHWTRKDKFDYYWPEFAQLGEQEVNNSEIKETFGQEPDGVFGYQSRYAEYKYKQSSVHGDFRDQLNYWHLGRQFDEVPVLNEDFVQSDPDTRIFAVTDTTEDHLYVQIYNNISAIRPMPYFNVPTL